MTLNTEPTRTTRLSAISRFRRERMVQQVTDLEARQQGIMEAAQRVMEIIQDSQTFLKDTRNERRAGMQQLRAELSKFKIDLKDDTLTALSTLCKERQEDAKLDRIARESDLDKLRAEVVRIVSEDFI